MQELINSMVRFSAAMTLFSLQQLQNTVELAVDSQAALKKFREALDSVSNAVSAQLGDALKPTADSVSKFGTDLVDRTWDAMNVSAFDPREVIQTTGDLVRKTTDSLADMMKKTTEPAKSSSGEPQPAAEALSGR
jgi:hypothetical protein